MNLRSNSAFTITEVIIAVGVSSLVGVGVMTNLVDSQKTEQRSNKGLNLEAKHLIATAKMQSANFWKSKLSIAPGSEISMCFSANGTMCNTLNSTNFIEAEKIIATCPGADCGILSITSYKIDCPSSKKCNHIEAKTISTFTDPNPTSQDSDFKYAKKESSFIINSYAISEIRGLRNNCLPLSKAITSISLTQNEFFCEGTELVGRCSTSFEPPKTLNVVTFSSDCQKIANENCASYGFTRIGAFLGNSACMPGAPSSAGSLPNGTPILPANTPTPDPITVTANPTPTPITTKTPTPSPSPNSSPPRNSNSPSPSPKEIPDYVVCGAVKYHGEVFMYPCPFDPAAYPPDGGKNCYKGYRGGPTGTIVSKKTSAMNMALQTTTCE